MEHLFFISEDSFRVWLPDTQVWEGGSSLFKSEAGKEPYNSRRIGGIMSTARRDRQGEKVIQKGIDVAPFMSNGHFNDNHDQATSAIVGYPEHCHYDDDLDGWYVEGYVIKGTKRSDDIWELAKALQDTPRRLGFSIEGRVLERGADKTIKKALIRNVAITNCPVNTDATWDVLAKSFYEPPTQLQKALAAGYGYAGAPGAMTGGAALSTESLERKGDERKKKKVIKSELSLEEIMAMRPYLQGDEELALRVLQFAASRKQSG